MLFYTIFIGLFIKGKGVAVQNQFFGVDMSSLRVQLNENKIKFLITVGPEKLTTDNNASLKRKGNGEGALEKCFSICIHNMGKYYQLFIAITLI